MGTLPSGSFTLDIQPGKLLPSPKGERVLLKGFMALPMDYSAAIMMDNELDATSGAFMSMNQLGRIVIDALLFILVLLIVCLIIYIVHKRRIQEGHPPYSNLYVIIPHVILIVIFYRGLAATSYTNTNAFIYFLMMAVYTLIAVRAYHGPFRQR